MNKLISPWGEIQGLFSQGENLKTIKITVSSGNKYEIKKLNFIQRAACGLLPTNITNFIKTMVESNEKTRKEKETKVDMFLTIGDVYEIIKKDLLISPAPTQELFDELPVSEIMELFRMAILGVNTETRLNEAEKETENLKK